jgi:hypothetical protein
MPLFADLLLRREWRRAAWMALPVAASAGLLLALNAALYGSPLRPPQPFVLGNPWDGFMGLLFSRQWGLFLFCPIVAVALLCWPAFVRRHGRPAVVLGAGFALFFVLMISYGGWHGSYGPRHIVPVLPLLLASLTALPDVRFYRLSAVKAVVWGLVVVGVVANGFGVFFYSQCWGRNPYEAVLALPWPR